MKTFNVKLNGEGDGGWEGVNAITHSHAARIYGAALAVRESNGYVSSFMVDVQATTANSPLFTFLVKINMHIESKLVNK